MGQEVHLALQSIDQEIMVLGDILNRLPCGKRSAHATSRPRIPVLPLRRSGLHFLILQFLDYFQEAFSDLYLLILPDKLK